MSFYDDFPEYFPVELKKHFAKFKRKKHNNAPVTNVEPVKASTWWGRAWNRNIEKYSDWENRLERGLDYFLNGHVEDLKIAPGRIDALVNGSDFIPYDVEIHIKPIPAAAWKKTVDRCGKKRHLLQELNEGHFPEALSDLLLKKDGGLFPAGDEIDFECSCPDSAYMCKHVAAVLYSIGTHFDENPSLFFKLRQVNTDGTVAYRMNKRSDKPSKIKNVAGGKPVSSGHFLISQYFVALIEAENDPARLKKLAAIFAALAEYASKKAALLRAMNGL
jgi:uncharacterized Zn finger protein